MEPVHVEEVEVEAEVLDGELMISSASFEVDISGIQADIAELTTAIDEALTVYGDMLVDLADIETMGYAETRRRERAVSAVIREADALRRQLNRDYRVPLDAAKVRYDELMEPVIQLHEAYKQRRVQLDDQAKDQKKQAIAALYEAIAPRYALPGGEGAEGREGLGADLAEPPERVGRPMQPPVQLEPLVPFERIFSMFGGKWLNKGVGLDTIELELGGIARMISNGEHRLSEAAPRHATESWAVFWQTLDVEAALVRDRELCALEERQAALEQARAREQALREQPAETSTLASQGEESSATAQQAAEADAMAGLSCETPASTEAELPVRKPRIMIIDGATDDECRQIAALCTSLGITGTFKGPRFHESVMSLLGNG